MPRNIKVTEETFGVDATNPKLRKGSIEIVGHTVRNGEAIPERGNFSVNTKTGEPVKSAK